MPPDEAPMTITSGFSLGMVQIPAMLARRFLLRHTLAYSVFQAMTLAASAELGGLASLGLCNAKLEVLQHSSQFQGRVCSAPSQFIQHGL